MQAASRAVNGLDCISVTRPGRWGNPYDVRVFGRELSMRLFRNKMAGVWDPSPVAHLRDAKVEAAYKAHTAFLKRLGSHPIEIVASELGGRNLGCYCKPPEACHADILLELANIPAEGGAAHGAPASGRPDATGQPDGGRS